MPRRHAFTLVELLVAMALILFMMVILSQAFSVGVDSFRRLKAIGDLNARLRTAFVALQADLQADHFEGRRRVSDPNFWSAGPPANGFFRIWHGGRPTVEDADLGGDGIPSTRAVNHILALAVKRRGNEREDFFLASVPAASPLRNSGLPGARYQDTPGVFTSQWIEAAYFLRPTGDTTGGTPLYALYRRQRLAVPDDHDVNRGVSPVPAGDYGRYLELSCRPRGSSLYFNGPMDLTIPQRRLGMDPAANGGVIPASAGGLYPRLEDDLAAFPGGPDLAAADLLLPDVISFEVTVLLENGGEFIDLYHDSLRRFDSGNPRFQGNGPRVFDTWTAYQDDTYDYSRWDERGQDTSIPLYQDNQGNQIRITAVKVTLRIWDVKTRQARQVSLIQDM